MKGETVLQHTFEPGEPDRYGKPTRAESTRSVDGVGVAPELGSDTLSLSRDSLTREQTLYLPAGTAVDTSDEFTVRGTRYKVAGLPAEWVSYYTGFTPGVVVKIVLKADTNG
ncbi:hypothetical protein AS850_02695 [Frondihabitans sp. 762G35]|uniref:hypothetical protein n=1 Tax=Frondihabitans sp. 762G35 TaxID=1446794 RepID=UPI000D20A574|nr:hypothetical protein [Frondihabitans sp. 762G35]ARC55981.1 hypothetical protein AS850_02695 [Frondihabitans sp. 762G35]